MMDGVLSSRCGLDAKPVSAFRMRRSMSSRSRTRSRKYGSFIRSNCLRAPLTAFLTAASALSLSFEM